MGFSGQLPWLDILFICVYLFGLMCIGTLVILKHRKGNVQHYFLAGRTMSWYAVGGSLFSVNIGTESVIGLAGAGAAAGISMVMYEWLPIFIILMFTWFLLPVYISAQVYTLPEYMEKRFGANRLRIYLSFVGIVITVITKMATVMFSGALFIQVVVRWDMNVAIVALLAVSMVFTLLGGLKAVMIIGALQTVMLLSGGMVVMILSFIQIGGYENLKKQYAFAIPGARNNNTTCGLPREEAFHVFQDPLVGDQPWPGLILQASLGGIFNWCCSQVIIQRSLAARSLPHAKGGAIVLSIMKLFPLFLILFPGMISRILYTDDVACTDPDVCKSVCDNPAGCSNIAYPMLIMGLLPVGIRGLLIAVMISGIMVTLSSVTNSTSTVFTMDVWRKMRPLAKQRELLIVGRVSVAVICCAAFLWIPLIKAFQNGRLLSYVVAVRGYMGSPLGVVFFFSVVWKGATEQGAFWGIISAHALGMLRLVMELLYPAPSCGEKGDNRIFISRLHYTYFVVIQMVFTVLVMWCISLVTNKRSAEQLEGVTWWTKVLPHDDVPATNDNELEFEEIRTNPTLSRDKNASLPLLTPATPAADDTEISESRGLRRRLSEYLCGGNEGEHDEEHHFDMAETKYFLREDKKLSTIMNTLAVALMVGVGFILGFYK